eukprot:jgi/Mesvir1/6477/Mv19551-RA.1
MATMACKSCHAIVSSLVTKDSRPATLSSFARRQDRRNFGRLQPASISSRRHRGPGFTSFTVKAALEGDESRNENLTSAKRRGVALEEQDMYSSEMLPRSRQDDGEGPLYKLLYPDQSELPDDVPMPIWEHLEELRGRVLVSVGVVGILIMGCFIYAKDLVKLLEVPAVVNGVRFLQLSPGEFFFTTLKVSGYSGLLLGGPVILYEIIAFVLPGLTASERRFLAPIVFGSSILFYFGLGFSYNVLTPAALTFFVNFADGVVESLWSIDQYFEFVLVLMFSTGLAFQVPVIQVLLGQTGIVSSAQMFGVWRYVLVGSTVIAAVLTPSTDPLTQSLLAVPLCCLYFGGALLVKLIEDQKNMVSPRRD